MADTLKQKIIESHKPIGVKKQSNWKLPPSDFAYGFKVKPDAEDVSVITRSWVEHKPSKPIESKPDFITINKIAVEKKIVDPKANKEFRKTVDIRQKIPEGKKHLKGEGVSGEITYGKRNRTPTPVKEVINNEFGKKYEDQLMRNYEKIINEKTVGSKNENTNTKEDLKPMKKNKKEEEENKNNITVFKNKKYNDVKSKVKENIRSFKTSSKNDNLDDLINKVENEIKLLEGDKSR